MENKQLIQNSNEQKTEVKLTGTEPPYTKEFKDQLVAVFNSGVYETAADCARSYQVPEKIFYQWLASSRKKASPVEQNLEVAMLRKENSQLKMENEILKKATVYFAKQMK